MNKAEKSLRWVVNQIPDFKPTTNEEKMLVAIKLYSEAGAEEIRRLEAENVALRNEADENAALSMENKMRADRLEKENAVLHERLDKAVALPCKVGDKVYGVGFTDCEDSRTTDEKKKRQIFNVCMKMGGNCEKCKYRRPQIEEFVCTHIQLGDCGIEGKSILIVGDRNENYTANNVFTTSEAAEARLAELKGEKE